MDYLTIGTLWKNENEYAEEFLTYHRSVGVEKFIIYDREYNELYKLIGHHKDVQIFHFPENTENVHANAWASLISRCKGQTKWLALIDADQVLVPVQTNDVRGILKDYENFASVGMNWHSFGSSGHINKIEGSLYERFTMRANDNEGMNNHIQSIVQPDRTLAVRTHDPHHCQLMSGEVNVNTNKEVISGPFNNNHCYDKLWVAHYITKSKEEWAIKNAKGRADIFNEKMPFNMFDDHNKICNAVEELHVKELWKAAIKI